jgi:hypothetical protein
MNFNIPTRLQINCSDGIMVSEFASSPVAREFESRSDETKDNKIDICYFLVKHTELRGKNKE